MNRTLRVGVIVAGFALTLAAIFAFVSCGVAALRDSDSADLVPAAYGPRIDNVNYCGYFYDPVAELAQMGAYGQTCRPVLYPPVAPLPSAADYYMAHAAWLYLAGNYNTVHGAYYYDHVLLPASRHSTVIVVNRNTYINDGAAFGRRADVRRDRTEALKRYPPTFKKANDKSATPKIFKGDKYASEANKRADVTKEQTAKKYGGLNPGLVTDPAKAAKTGNAGPARPVTGGGLSGKTDTVADPGAKTKMKTTGTGGASAGKVNRTSSGSNAGKTSSSTRSTTTSRSTSRSRR